MTDGHAVDLLLAGKAVKFPDGKWHLMTGQEDNGLFTWRKCNAQEAKTLEIIAITCGIPGPAEDVA